MSEFSQWELGIDGNFPVHRAVVKGNHTLHSYPPTGIDTNFAVLPRGTRIVTAESCGISAWTKTAKVSVILSDGILKRYFLKVTLPSSG